MKKFNIIWQTCNGDQTTFEYEYITNVLLKNLSFEKIYDDCTLSTVKNNSVIVYSNNATTVTPEFESYLKKFSDQNLNYWLIHLSNENLSHNTNYYEKTKKVFRNYYDSSIKEKNVIFIPLGFKSGFYNYEENQSEYSTNKIYNFSFIGQPKSDRNELINVLEKFKNTFIHKTNSWNCVSAMNQDECKNIYKVSKFTPCPMGWVHPDSFRIMESMEWGSIPILKIYNNLDWFSNVWGESPLPIINNWCELENYNDMDEINYKNLHNEVFNWYKIYKKELNSKILMNLNQ